MSTHVKSTKLVIACQHNFSIILYSNFERVDCLDDARVSGLFARLWGGAARVWFDVARVEQFLARVEVTPARVERPCNIKLSFLFNIL